MKTHNANNERIKHRYFKYLRGAKGYSSATLETVAKALSRFDSFNKYRDFSTFRFEQADSFKEYLTEARSSRTDQPLSASTIHATLGVLRAFFHWLSLLRGYRGKLDHHHADYFRVSLKDARIATARRIPTFPTPEQVVQAVVGMPIGTDVERRDQALVAFIFLTAVRDGAAISIRLGDIDLIAGHVNQDPRHVKTKNSKYIVTGFFPVDPRIRDIVVAWITFLRVEKGCGPDKPAFPATARSGNDWRSPPIMLATNPWKSSDPVRTIFRKTFERAGLPYFNPHSLRHTTEDMGERRCRTDAERKAWSQNLGHEHIRTSFDAYAPMDKQRQLEIMRGLATSPPPQLSPEDHAKKLFDTWYTEMNKKKSDPSPDAG
jgi:integrase